MVEEYNFGIDGKPSSRVHRGTVNVSGWIYSHTPDQRVQEDRYQEENERYDSRQSGRLLSWLREHS